MLNVGVFVAGTSRNKRIWNCLFFDEEELFLFFSRVASCDMIFYYFVFNLFEYGWMGVGDREIKGKL